VRINLNASRKDCGAGFYNNGGNLRATESPWESFGPVSQDQRADSEAVSIGEVVKGNRKPKVAHSAKNES
jgi:hypothetical protein